MERTARTFGGDDVDRASSMPMSAHLRELRRRLIACGATYGVAAIVGYLAYPRLLRVLERPYCRVLPSGHPCALYVTGPLDGFSIRLNATAYLALVLSSPVILFELWRFVTPGLRAHERRVALPFAGAAFLLFGFGAAVAWVMFPHALAFLDSVSGAGITELFSPARYLGLMLSLMAIVGIAFELPVVLVALELARVVTPRQLARSRRFAVVAIVVVAGIATPSSDPFSMLAMAVPMIVFYEAAIVTGRLARR